MKLVMAEVMDTGRRQFFLGRVNKLIDPAGDKVSRNDEIFLDILIHQTTGWHA